MADVPLYELNIHYDRHTDVLSLKTILVGILGYSDIPATIFCDCWENSDYEVAGVYSHEIAEDYQSQIESAALMFGIPLRVSITESTLKSHN